MGNLTPYTMDLAKRDDYEKGEPVRLIWTSDWHVESICCDYDAIRMMLKQELGKPNTYFANGGDWLNLTSFIASHANAPMGGLLDSTRSEFIAPDWINKGIERIYELAKPSFGRWLMLHSGNHDRRLEVLGKSLIADMKEKLGGEYGGVQTFWTIKANGSKLRILSGHGYGGGYGEYLGALGNKLSRMLGRFAVDLILLGHYHQGVSVSEMELGQGGKEIHKAGAISPAMLRTYQNNQMNYAASRFMPYRGVGYVLVKWMPETGFFKPEVITIPEKK